jgi:hypothetical protein
MLLRGVRDSGSHLAKLRAKGLVAKLLPNSRRYQLLPHGYSICLVFLAKWEAEPLLPERSWQAAAVQSDR